MQRQEPAGSARPRSAPVSRSTTNSPPARRPRNYAITARYRGRTARERRSSPPVCLTPPIKRVAQNGWCRHESPSPSFSYRRATNGARARRAARRPADPGAKSRQHLCRVALPSFQAGGAWLACAFRVAPLLGSLIAQARVYGYQLRYHVNLRPVTVDREWLRAARVNALAVGDLPGVPVALVRMQQRLADQLSYETTVCEEYLAVDSELTEQWLQEALRRHFHQEFGALRFESPSWEFVKGRYVEELACAMFTPAIGTGVDELCASAIQDDQMVRLLGWRPSGISADPPEDPRKPDTLEMPDVAVGPENPPLAYHGDDPYIFVSYKRTDMGRVAPVMRHLQERGWNLWYDRGVPGGANWNAMLEERLTSCSALLLFVSQAAVDSKYVRREVQFADKMNKPIIRVQLEATRLEHGMKFLLDPLQGLDPAAPDFLAQLDRAVRLSEQGTLTN